MSEQLRAIAARYASALKVSDKLGDGAAGFGVPSASDIWLYKLEDAGRALVTHWKNKKKPWGDHYDECFIYAHRFCMNTAEDVENAPDSVLFEMMGLHHTQYAGWLQFMRRDLGWHSMLAANWGLPVLRIPDGVTYSTTTPEQRRAQVVSYFLELMRERGFDPLGELLAEGASLGARFKGRRGREWAAGAFARWLRRGHPWGYYLHAGAASPNPASVLTPPGKPAYTGDQRVQLAAKIREAAARRRRNWDAPHPADCLERERERIEREGLEAERGHFAHVLRMEGTMRRGEDIGVIGESELLPRLLVHLEQWTSAEYHIRNSYLHDRLEIFLARNERARDLLRLPENRELALKVRKEVYWLHLPAD